MSREKKSNREKYMEPAEFMSLLEAAASNQRDYTLLAVAGNLGLRVGEAVRLREEDYYEDRITVPCLKRGRTGRIRRNQLPKDYESLPLVKEVSELIEAWLESRPEDKWIFPGRGGHLTERSAEKIFEKYRDIAELNQAYSFHSLRHTRGMALHRSEKDMLAVQSGLRHKDIRSSKVYVTMDEEHQRKVFDRTGIVLPPKPSAPRSRSKRARLRGHRASG